MLKLSQLSSSRSRILVGVLACLLLLILALIVIPGIKPGAAAAAVEPDASSWISCVPNNVTVYTGRIHVRCAAAVNGIQYFAVSTQDSQSAARFLTILTTAQVAGRTLQLLYNTTDTSGTAFGCQASDCRVLQAAMFGN